MTINLCRIFKSAREFLLKEVNPMFNRGGVSGNHKKLR